MNEEHIQDSIEVCWECRHECQVALYTYCLQEGGDHADADHVKLMTDCIQICQTAADFMTRESDLYAAVCAACADICEACAESCRKVGMEECAKVCAECAESCRAMSGSLKRKAA